MVIDCLIDTNIAIQVFRNDSKIIDNLDSFSQVFISSISVGELYYGAHCSNNLKKQSDLLESFLEKCIIKDLNHETALIYSELKFTLRKQGTLIPENDIWIASHSFQHKLPLYTLDSHFRKINDLIVF